MYICVCVCLFVFVGTRSSISRVPTMINCRSTLYVMYVYICIYVCTNVCICVCMFVYVGVAIQASNVLNDPDN